MIKELEEFSEEKLAVFPELRYARERELKVSEIIALALKVFARRPGVFLLCALMFSFPVNFVLAYVQSRVPDLSQITDPIAYMNAYVQEMLPVLLWNLGLSFFVLLGTLTVILVTYSELYGKEKMPFGMAFFRAFKRFPAAASAYLVLILSLVTVMLFCSVLSTMLPFLSALAAGFILLYAAYFALMKESTSVVAIHTGLALWRNTACVARIFRDRLGRVFGRFILLVILTQLPGILISIAAGFGIELIGSKVWMLLASGAAASVESVFSFFLSACVTVMVNNLGDLVHREDLLADKSEKNS